MADGALTCPSTRAAPGAALIGVVGRDGRVRHVRTALTIDAGFVEEASRAGPPEARMRFAGRCVEGACAQWTGTRCGVIDRVLGLLGPEGRGTDGLPACTVRATCRWYAQAGRDACGACVEVVTDSRAAVAAE